MIFVFFVFTGFIFIYTGFIFIYTGFIFIYTGSSDHLWRLSIQ